MLFFCQVSIVILLFYSCVVLLIGVDSILKLFFAYLKQFKFHTIVHSTQILFHLVKTKYVVKIQLDYQKAKYNKYKIKSMFLHQIHTSIFILNYHIKF